MFITFDLVTWFQQNLQGLSSNTLFGSIRWRQHLSIVFAYDIIMTLYSSFMT